MKKSLGVVLGVLLFASVLGAKDDKKAPPKSSLQGFLQQFAYYPVPFEYNEGDPFMLKGTVNGKGIVLMVDTGSPLTALDPRRTAGLKTLKELHTKISDALLGTIDEPDALLIPSITIAQARFVNQPAMANTLDVEYMKTPWNGILGLDFLKRNFCIIDCGGSTIYFRGAKPTPDQANAIAESLRRSGFTELPFHGTHRIKVTAALNGKPVKWLVDTGASFTVLAEATRATMKIPIMRADSSESFLPTALTGRFGGLTQDGLGTHEVHALEISDFTIADRDWGRVYIASHDLIFTDGKKLSESDDLQGILGADLLRSHGAVIDLSSDTIWLPPARS